MLIQELRSQTVSESSMIDSNSQQIYLNLLKNFESRRRENQESMFLEDSD